MQKEKTEYREVNVNGHYSYLEYLSIEKVSFLFFWTITIKKWKRIWKPYYDKIRGRHYVDDYRLVIHSQNTRLTDFVKKYPYIEDYFVKAELEQVALEQKAKAYKEELNSKKGVKYL